MAATTRAIQQFTDLSDEECDARIRAAKAALGDRLAILGHHYQREEVFRHADYTGDSLKLSRQAASSMPNTSSSAACISWPRWRIS